MTETTTKLSRALLSAALPAAALLFAAAGPASAATSGGYGLSVLVDGASRPEYAARGSVYVEAVRGRDYALRVVNPFPYRVAVALSVDGLNTIDAKRTDARSARKWVLEPYGEVVLEGWQVSEREARRFTFTGERSSYGAFLGKTEDLGVIEAVFFRERPLEPQPSATDGYRDAPRREAAKGALGSAAGAPAAPESKQALSDENAATGMGGRTDHRVRRVDLDLESSPSATVRIRYEFRPQLVKLGVLSATPSPLERRERSRGFEGSYCPEPGR